MNTDTVTSFRADIRGRELAALVVEEFVHTEAGHCARVNFFRRDEAEAICALLPTVTPPGQPLFEAYVLVNSSAEATNPLCITSDYAIELRNRKRGQFCLFVPTDVVGGTLRAIAL